MNTQKKSLALAELMRWELFVPEGTHPDMLQDHILDYEGGLVLEGMPLVPYIETRNGLAQFAAILLKYPEVMANFCRCESSGLGDGIITPVMDVVQNEGFPIALPTQSAILDEVLRMNGIAIGDCKEES